MTVRMILYIVFVIAYFFLAIYRAYDNYMYKDMDLAQAIIPNFLSKTLLAIVVYFIFL